MGEYDALPGISQKAQPTREALEEGAPGHGCGHNMFGAASLGAAVAIKRLIADGTLKGTIRFFGTPAEEDVGGKIYMAREGVFKGVDVMLAWHPETEPVPNCQLAGARRSRSSSSKEEPRTRPPIPGTAAARSMAPEAFTHGINMLREHVRPTVAHALRHERRRRAQRRSRARAGLVVGARSDA